jgi:type II secretory pathway predicted ATPase ExeA/cell division septation protein DedD
VKPAKDLSPDAEFRSRLSWFLGVSEPLPTDPETLTYEPYFGLREKPFSLAADPRFFFTQSGHGSAFSTLAAGIKLREGILVLTGEVGAGKTTLCRAVLQSLDRKTFAAFVSDPFLSREDLLKTLLVDFGVISPDEIRRGALRGASRGDLSHPLHEFLASLVPLRAFAVVIIDEAHSLSAELLDEIRVLSDLEAGPKLLQVFLVGQPELETRLAEPGMRQLSQRISVHCELPPLSAAEVRGYIAHRLEVAGNDGRIRVSEAAVEAIHAAAGGIPRVINLLCDRALTRAAQLESTLVDADTVAWARSDLKLAGASPPTLSLVHSKPARPSWRAEPEHAPATELELPEPPESLVEIVSGAMGEPDGKSHENAAPSVDTASSTAAEPVRDTRKARTRAAIGVALLIVSGIAAYRLWPARRVEAPAAIVQSPVVAPRLTVPPQQESATTPEPSPAVARTPADNRAAATPAAENRAAILMATFVSDARTAKSLQEIRDAGFPAFSVEVSLRDGERGLAVYVGPYDDRANAERDLARAQALSGYEDARIVAIKRSVQP